MSYQRRFRRKRSLSGLGGIADTVTTALDVAGDPYLPEIVCRVKQLKAIDHFEPVPACTNTPDGLVTLTSGVGLRNAVPALRAYVYAQQNKWVYLVGAAAIVGLPMLLGYELGKDHGK